MSCISVSGGEGMQEASRWSSGAGRGSSDSSGYIPKQSRWMEPRQESAGASSGPVPRGPGEACLQGPGRGPPRHGVLCIEGHGACPSAPVHWPSGTEGASWRRPLIRSPGAVSTCHLLVLIKAAPCHILSLRGNLRSFGMFSITGE